METQYFLYKYSEFNEELNGEEAAPLPWQEAADFPGGAAQVRTDRRRAVPVQPLHDAPEPQAGPRQPHAHQGKSEQLLLITKMI